MHKACGRAKKNGVLPTRKGGSGHERESIQNSMTWLKKKEAVRGDRRRN